MGAAEQLSAEVVLRSEDLTAQEKLMLIHLYQSGGVLTVKFEQLRVIISVNSNSPVARVVRGLVRKGYIKHYGGLGRGAPWKMEVI